MRRPDISEVFTPRPPEVNGNMYVERPDLERSALRSIRRHTHSILFGDSGNGKSWLFKTLLDIEEIPNAVANCANASRLGSLTQEICNVLVPTGSPIKLSYTEKKAAEANAVVLKGALEHNGAYGLAQEEPLLNAFRLFSKSHGKGRKILVLDNLESIFSKGNLMDELADIVILLDDPRYAQFNINLLIVGIPNGILEYFRKTKNVESVANRLEEIQKVGGLTQGQVRELVRRGFTLLQAPLPSDVLPELSTHIHWRTLGIAQRVHEYCEALAYEIADNGWLYSRDLIRNAERAWLSQGLRQSYQVLESHLNSIETTVARRNQVLFAIGRTTTHQFNSNDIDAIIRKEFPDSIPKTNMGIGSILMDLSKGGTPFLSKNEKASCYSVKDPRFLMCIRAALYKSERGRVEKRQFAL